VTRLRRLAAAGAVVATLALSACTEGSPLPDAPDLSTDVDVGTPELRDLRKEAGIDPCPELDGAGSDLPDVTLPCLGGGPEVSLSDVAGPAVVPVWAQWCGPCREELPWFEQLHRAAGDRLTVLGVNWQDVQPEGALRFAADAGVTFPSAADPDAELRDGGRGLPLLYLVDDDGAVTLRRGQVDSYEQLVGLVEDHTGVRVARG
jgi:thiol-disulfide isomerase/thioredoxin